VGKKSKRLFRSGTVSTQYGDIAMTDSLNLRKMKRAELDELVGWTVEEGWNPGIGDADIFWTNDPDGFIAAELDGEFLGGGAITCYQGDFGFMGLFIVKPEYRGRGFGNTIWQARRRLLLDRLKPGSSIGMDGVFAMQDYYAKGGFAFSHRNLRFQLDVPHHAHPPLSVDEQITPLKEVPLQQVLDYDRTCFPASRTGFLKAWMTQANGLAVGYRKSGTLVGYGVVRRCQNGCKVGPLFADDSVVAESLINHLLPFAAGGPLFIDSPENNPAAMELVQRYNMKEVYGCARMYLGEKPTIQNERIFGVTTFELG
jgi:GNAT superfamily N-acetyltransferase